MSIALCRLFDEKNNPYELVLLAGRDGLSREVSWVQVMEDIDYASFLLQNELIFTTGLGKDNQKPWLKNFITALIQVGSSGLVINIGKYLVRQDIEQDIIDICNDYSFPLFVMPWRMRLSDITQSFLYSLFLTKQKEYEIIEACRKLFFCPPQTEKAINHLKAQGYGENSSYQVLSLFFGKDHHPDNMDTLLTSYKFILNKQSASYILFPSKKAFILILQDTPKEEARRLFELLCSPVTLKTPAVPITAAGCGMIVLSLRTITVSYRQSVYALAWAHMEGKKFQYFGNLGIYALFFSQTDDMSMRELHDRTLGPLLQYDESHQRDLFQTLQSYLIHNGSIQAVSKETYAHRNTVAYRVQKIKKLLGCDLNDESTRFTCFLACHIHYYWKVLQEERFFLNE
ncbi:MAG: PucR family transcriptional regulator ligand-binding domain-containing protein [Megasphaera cerevisiae]|jgi:hypothetical protein|nr:PucR family transcriptional regulator ligand-binding domain-containing protein [Megasphaera cerevisiae]